MYTAEASVNVSASPQTAWEYVSNYQNFDQFMPSIQKIELLSGDTSEWHLSGPLGIPVSWQAITTIKEAPQHLAWHSTKGMIDHVVQRPASHARAGRREARGVAARRAGRC